MLSGFGAVVLTTSVCLGQLGLGGAGCSTCGSGYGSFGGMPAGGYYGGGYGGAVTGAMPYAGSAYGSGSSMDELYPYDAPDPWLHGYFQNMPAYGGFRYFRPYNYKHALSQSTRAGQWGISPSMPYSQQFWHRYQDKASLNPPPRQAASTDYAAEYARELARLRAWQDFQARQGQGASGVRPTGVGSAFSMPQSAWNGGTYRARPSYGMPPRSSSPYAESAAGSPYYGAPRPGANGLSGGSPRWSADGYSATPPGPGPAIGTPTGYWSNASDGGYPSPPRYSPVDPRVVDVPPPPGRLDTSSFRNAAQVQQLQEQLRQQAQQIQALQGSLNQRADQPRWPSPPNTGWNARPQGY